MRVQRPYQLFAATEHSWGMYLVATYSMHENARLRALTLLQRTNPIGRVEFCSVEDSRTGETVWRGLRAGEPVPGVFKDAKTLQPLNIEVVAFTPEMISK